MCTLVNKIMDKFGVIVIGRNEGLRLLTCLNSVISQATLVVYVDSGSSDDSILYAQKLGVEVVALDLAIPFTAARARNEGASRLRELSPDITYIQFVDGDCEVLDGWLEKAIVFMNAHTDVAVVSGRCRERYPNKSIYNLMCDIEWDTPIGQTKSSGGNAMMRATFFFAVGGFRPSLIAGEEPELCVRLRAAGWKIWRIDAEMVLHDAAMTRFRQWWKRAVRGGHAYAEGASLHGDSVEKHCVKETRRIWVWGLGIPILVLFAIGGFGSVGLLLILIYPIQITRLALRCTEKNPANWWSAYFLVLSKFPELIGQIKFHLSRMVGKKSRLIEYK